MNREEGSRRWIGFWILDSGFWIRERSHGQQVWLKKAGGEVERQVLGSGGRGWIGQWYPE